MTAPHLPSDDTAIRAADERKMLNAERHARETFEAWLTRRQHPVASERLMDAIRAANSERWNQMERALVPMPQGVEPWQDGPALTDRAARVSETGESLTRDPDTIPECGRGQCDQPAYCRAHAECHYTGSPR